MKKEKQDMPAAEQFPSIDLAATGANFTRLRKEAGLAVRDVQEYFGFSSPRAIYQWQCGACVPSIDNLLGLSRLLGVTVEDILVLVSFTGES